MSKYDTYSYSLLIYFLENQFQFPTNPLVDNFSEETLWLNKRKKSFVGKWHKFFGHNFVNNGRRVAIIWHNMRNTISNLYSKSFENRQSHLSTLFLKKTLWPNNRKKTVVGNWHFSFSAITSLIMVAGLPEFDTTCATIFWRTYLKVAKSDKSPCRLLILTQRFIQCGFWSFDGVYNGNI